MFTKNILGVQVCMKLNHLSRHLCLEKTRHGSLFTFMPIKSTEMSIPCKTQHLFLYWYISESQNIYACADGMFEQERKPQCLWASRQSVVPDDTGISTRASLSDVVGPSLISDTDLHPDTAVRKRNVDPQSV